MKEKICYIILVRLWSPSSSLVNKKICSSLSTLIHFLECQSVVNILLMGLVCNRLRTTFIKISLLIFVFSFLIGNSIERKSLWILSLSTRQSSVEDFISAKTYFSSSIFLVCCQLPYSVVFELRSSRKWALFDASSNYM